MKHDPIPSVHKKDVEQVVTLKIDPRFPKEASQHQPAPGYEAQPTNIISDHIHQAYDSRTNIPYNPELHALIELRHRVSLIC